MRIRYPFAALLFAVGCHDKAKEASQAAAAKSAEAAEIDERSKVVAQDLIQKAEEDARTKREADAQQKRADMTRLRQATMDHPEEYVTSDKLQLVDTGERHLTSIQIKNGSKFTMSDLRGTVDFHDPDAPGGVVAQVPVELTGAIAPGASMVFSEQQHTLSGAGVRLATAPSSVSFAITKMTLGMEGIGMEPNPAPPEASVAGTP